MPSTFSPKIGPLIGPYDVEQAVLATLATWLPTYLYEIEQDRGLASGALTRPPTPESVRGDLDHEAWEQDENPTVTAFANPAGGTERAASGGYGQTFDTEVSATVTRESPDDARMLAGYYGPAIEGAVLQQGSLGGFATRTRLASSARLEYPDADIRTTVRALVGFQVFVQPIVNDLLGLDVPTPPRPPFGSWPQVTQVWPVTAGSTPTTNVTVTSLPIPATFTASTNQNSNLLTGVSPAPFTVVPGQAVRGLGIPVGTYVYNVNPQLAQITLSQNATATATGVSVSFI